MPFNKFKNRKSAQTNDSAIGVATTAQAAHDPRPDESLLDPRTSRQESDQQLIDGLLRELDATKTQLADIKKCAEAKDQELEDIRLSEINREENEENAGGISRKCDILSTTAIIQKLDILNAEVSQVAVSLGKMLHKIGFNEGVEGRITHIADSKARVLIGEDMVTLLAEESLKTTLDLNPLLVQVVLQIAITSWCKSAVSSWKFGDNRFSDSLAELYSKIRQSEDPTFSLRWRSATRAQMQFSSDDWTQDLLNGLLSVLTIAGWSTREPDQQCQLAKQFSPIFNAVLDLRKALEEDISMDVEVTVVEPRTIFNSASMDDAWDGRSSLAKQASQIVSGTTGLGLQKIVMKPSTQGLVSQPEILCLPKVVLECTVKEALSPLPPLKKVAQVGECVKAARDAIHQTREPKADSREALPRSGRPDITAGDGEIQHDKDSSLTHELEAVKLQLAEAQALSEVRGKELKGAQAFLTKADTLSTTDVVQKVNALNDEIFQAAALLGEMLQNTESTDRTQEQATEAFEKATLMLGEQTTGILAAESVDSRPDLNPLLVQVVLQIAITSWCGFVVSSWQPSDTTAADFLSAIYSKIRHTEDQAVSGRWRSITRAQLRSSADDWTENLMSGLLSVLTIAGWSTREQDQQRQFERRLPPIFKAVQDVRKALGEDVTSVDMEVVIVESGESFSPSYMEDGYGDGSSSSGSGNNATPEKVSGTTGLGLQKTTMKETQDGLIPQTEIVLFPKVALEGTLKEAMGPAPPSTARPRKKPKLDGDSRSEGSGSGGGGGGVSATGGRTGLGRIVQSAVSSFSF